MDAVGYCRVSREDQARDGVSLAAQREQIRAYCRARRWRLVEVFADEGRSGKDLDRPGLEAALGALEEGRAGVLVVTKLDRLSRSVRHILTLVEEEFAHNGGSLVSIADNLDATTAMGRFVITLLAGLAQMEREQVSERTKAALAYVKESGRYLGRVPYGKKLTGEGRLVVDAEARNALRRAKRLRAKGVSWRKVAEALGWTVSQTRTRLDPSYRAQTRAGWEKRRQERGRP